MINVTEHTFGRLPHSHKQLARGAIGLLVGGSVAFLTGLIVSLMNAPIWFNTVVGALTTVAFAVAVVVPAWYWIVQPLVHGTGEGDEDDDEDA